LSVKVKLHGRLSRAAGSEEIELPSTVNTVGDLLEELVHRLGPNGGRYVFEPGTNEISPTLVLLVNGHSVKMLEGLRTPLVEQDLVTVDSVDIMEIVGGG
jgi:molybdopterin converting factor small subunit